MLTLIVKKGNIEYKISKKATLGAFKKQIHKNFNDEMIITSKVKKGLKNACYDNKTLEELNFEDGSEIKLYRIPTKQRRTLVSIGVFDSRHANSYGREVLMTG
jgi:hypothetical protein